MEIDDGARRRRFFDLKKSLSINVAGRCFQCYRERKGQETTPGFTFPSDQYGKIYYSKYYQNLHPIDFHHTQLLALPKRSKFSPHSQRELRIDYFHEKLVVNLLLHYSYHFEEFRTGSCRQVRF